MPKTPGEMLDAIRRNLPDRTGRTVQEWARLVKSRGPKGKKERIAWLRQEHGLGGPTASVIVAEAEGRDLLAPYADHDALVEAMFSGAKAHLRPVHDTVTGAAQRLGKDVRLEARKTYVSISRRRQFAAIQPSTRSRVDLGLVLPGVEPTGRLLASRNVGGGRVTHRLALEKPAAFDAEARRWLKEAYRRDGE